MKQNYIHLVLGIVLVPSLVFGTESRPRMKDFLGINGHFHFKPELYQEVCRLVRNYHPINWDVKKPGDPITFPVCVNKVNWNKHVYGKWVPYGFEVDLCAQFSGFGESNPDYRQLWQGQAEWFYRYGYSMARYFGPSGEHQLVTSIEIGNEPGNDFDDALYRELFVQAASGIRQADPEIRIVTATTHDGPADKYAKSLDETFASEAMKPLYDVINLHVYATKPKGTGQSPWDRSYPEDPALDYLKTVDTAIAWRNANAPDKAVWITEFGYDACTPEAMKHRTGWARKLNWTGVSDKQQAQYIVRSFLCFAERDVERAYLYFYNDDDQASVHAASGLTRKFEPKPSFWAMKQLYETLGDYRFRRIVHQQPDKLYVYEFTHAHDPHAMVWVAWSPTGSDCQQAVTFHDLPGQLVQAEAMALQPGQAETITPRIVNDSLHLTVTESPIYLVFEK